MERLTRIVKNSSCFGARKKNSQNAGNKNQNNQTKATVPVNSPSASISINPSTFVNPKNNGKNQQQLISKDETETSQQQIAVQQQPISKDETETSPQQIAVQQQPISKDETETSPQQIAVQQQPISKDETETSPQQIAVQQQPISKDETETSPQQIAVQSPQQIAVQQQPISKDETETSPQQIAVQQQPISKDETETSPQQIAVQQQPISKDETETLPQQIAVQQQPISKDETETLPQQEDKADSSLSKKYKDDEFNTVPPTNVKLGETTNSRRDDFTRMLDRITRLLLDEKIIKRQEGKDEFAIKTPHIAAVKLGKDIHLAGNTGNRYVRKLHSEKGIERILDIVNKGPDSQIWKSSGRRTQKDLLKLSKLLRDEYHKGEVTLAQLQEIKTALEDSLSEDSDKKVKWHQVDKKGTQVEGQGKVKSSLHGEMALHKPISSYAKDNKIENKTHIPIAGVKKDCLFCHWAHDILNKHVYKNLGYEIITAGTHGIPFPFWEAPQELISSPEALQEFRDRLSLLEGAWTMDNNGIVRSDTYNFNTISNDHNPYESESDGEGDDTNEETVGQTNKNLNLQKIFLESKYRENNCLIHAIADAARVNNLDSDVIQNIRNELKSDGRAEVGDYITADEASIRIIMRNLNLSGIVNVQNVQEDIQDVERIPDTVGVPRTNQEGEQDVQIDINYSNEHFFAAPKQQ
jgi:hypothetical protein